VPKRRKRVLVALLLIAASLLCRGAWLAGTTVFTPDPQDVATEVASQPDPFTDLPGPLQNLDHWHSVYGVWDCTANDGAGDWVPKFGSTLDDWGIHSHGDGIIHIHPFFEESAGRRTHTGTVPNRS